MIPNDFHDIGTLYTLDIESEIYELSPIGNNWIRIDSYYHEVGVGNYTYQYKFFDSNNKPLIMNGWTLSKMHFHQAWNDNYPPFIDIIDPNGIILNEFKIPEPFAKKESNIQGTRENRLSETYRFITYIAQYKSLKDYKFIYETELLTLKGSLRYYLEYLKIKDRLSSSIQSQVEEKLKNYFEKYLSQK